MGARVVIGWAAGFSSRSGWLAELRKSSGNNDVQYIIPLDGGDGSIHSFILGSFVRTREFKGVRGDRCLVGLISSSGCNVVRLEYG